MFAACLVLVVAVCDVTAQSWGGRGRGRGGVVRLDDCICGLDDVCMQRRGRMMCRRQTGGFYTPLGSNLDMIDGQGFGGLGGQGIRGQGIRGQRLRGQGFVRSDMINQGMFNRRQLGQAIVDRGLVGAGLMGLQGAGQGCCYQQDMFTCTTDSLSNRYLNGGSCTRFYFDGRKCRQISVNKQCVFDLRPRNQFLTAKECISKCSVGY